MCDPLKMVSRHSSRLRQEIPDILLSDLNMPGISGFELLSVVRDEFPAIQVIAMSGAFSGVGIPPGVCADAFYEKGSRLGYLLQIVEGMAHPKAAVVSPTSQHVGAHLDSEQRT